MMDTLTSRRRFAIAAAALCIAAPGLAQGYPSTDLAKWAKLVKESGAKLD